MIKMCAFKRVTTDMSLCKFYFFCGRLADTNGLCTACMKYTPVFRDETGKCVCCDQIVSSVVRIRPCGHTTCVACARFSCGHGGVEFYMTSTKNPVDPLPFCKECGDTECLRTDMCSDMCTREEALLRYHHRPAYRCCVLCPWRETLDGDQSFVMCGDPAYIGAIDERPPHKIVERGVDGMPMESV